MKSIRLSPDSYVLARKQVMESKLLESLVLGLCTFLLCLGLVVTLARHLGRRISRDPRMILRRSKRKLKLIRRELDGIPADHEILYLYNEIENAEHAIKHSESRFRHATGK